MKPIDKYDCINLLIENFMVNEGYEDCQCCPLDGREECDLYPDKSCFQKLADACGVPTSCYPKSWTEKSLNANLIN